MSDQDPPPEQRKRRKRKPAASAPSTDPPPRPEEGGGEKRPPGPSKLVLFGGGFLALFFLWKLSGGLKLPGEGNGPLAPPANATPPSQPGRAAAPERAQPRKADALVTAVKLWQDYEANEVAADEVYKGKTLLVTGKVASIDKDFMDNVVVRVATPNEFMSVSATVQDSEKPTAAKLTKGQAVSVLCEGGGRVIGSPVLKDCTIQ